MNKKLTLKMVIDNINHMFNLLEKVGLPEKFVDIHFYGNGEFCDVITLRNHLFRRYTFYASDITSNGTVKYREINIFK